MANNRAFLVINIMAMVAVFTVNVLAIQLPINGMDTGKISDLYPSLFTPAGFTFSIWSVIYFLQFGFIVIQFQIRNENYFEKLSRWYWLTCLANATWVLVWQYLFTAASVLVMFVLLYSLINIFLLLKKNKMNGRWQLIFIKLPFIIYFGWICVATIANIAALLVFWQWGGGFLSQEAWTMVMIAIASLLGLFIAYKFKEPIFLLVLMWAFFGIYSKWIGTEHEAIAQASRIAMVTLAVMAGKLFFDLRKSFTLV